jgi:uncharacterized membrane protein
MRLSVALILLLTVPLTTVPASAEFTVCNKASVPAKVALGEYNGTEWESRGWWTILSQKCETLIPGRLNARYYYLYGTDGESGTWSGSTYFCTLPQPKFTITGRGNCALRGYDRKGFFAVDTGNSPNWKQSLSN